MGLLLSWRHTKLISIHYHCRGAGVKDTWRWGHIGVRDVQKGDPPEQPTAQQLQQPSSPGFPNRLAAKGPPLSPILSHLRILLPAPQNPRPRAMPMLSESGLPSLLPQGRAGHCWCLLCPCDAPSPSIPSSPGTWAFSLKSSLTQVISSHSFLSMCPFASAL